MRDPFPAWSAKNSGHSRPISRGCVLYRKRERNTRVVPPNQESPIVSVHSRGPVFPVLPLHSRRGSTLTTVARWTALYEILVRKPRGKSSRESHRSHDRRDGKRHTAATAQEESALACPFWRGGLTSLGRLKNYPNIHFSTGEEASGSGPDSTEHLRPRHRWECNPRRPPNKSYGDWPVLRSPERVP